MKLMNITGPVRVLGAACLLAASTAVAAFGQSNLVITIDTGPGHLQTQMMNRFAAELAERSGGAMTAQVFDSAQLFNSRDAGRAVARGDAGMTILTSPALSRVEPNLNVFDLPMLNGMSVEQRTALVDGALGERLNAALEANMDVVVPGKWLLLGRVMYWSTQRPLNTLADFNGLQVRIPGGAANVARLEALGATAVVMPFADTPLALQQGVVDATMGSTETMLSQNLVDTGIRHAFWDEGIVGFRIPIVNGAYWNGLSAEEQTIFTTLLNELVMEERVTVIEGEVSDQAALEAQGVTFVTASAEDVARAREILMGIQDGLIAELGIAEDVVALAAAGIE